MTVIICPYWHAMLDNYSYIRPLILSTIMYCFFFLAMVFCCPGVFFLYFLPWCFVAMIFCCADFVLSWCRVCGTFLTWCCHVCGAFFSWCCQVCGAFFFLGAFFLRCPDVFYIVNSPTKVTLVKVNIHYQPSSFHQKLDTDDIDCNLQLVLMFGQ